MVFNPRTTVIIPILNRKEYISRALDSVMAQTIKDFEIIVIDGGSTDGGPEIIKSYKDDRIRLFVQKGNGISNARNYGVKLSRTNFLTFLDADDEWSNDHLEILLRLWSKFPNAGMYSQSYICKNNNNILRNSKIKMNIYSGFPKKPWEGIIPNYFESAVDGSNPVWTGVVGIPKKVFDNVGGFDENAIIGEDLDLWAKIALRYPVVFNWEIGAVYYKDAKNRVCSRVKPSEYHPVIVNGKKLLKNGDVPKQFIEIYKEFIAKKAITYAMENLIKGHPKISRKIIYKIETKKFEINKKKCLFYTRLPPIVYQTIHKWKFFLKPLIIIKPS